MKVIEILNNAQAGLGLQDTTQAPKRDRLLAVPRNFMNIVASNRSQARNELTNTEAAIELLQKLDWKYTFLQDEDGHLTDLLFMPGNCLG